MSEALGDKDRLAKMNQEAGRALTAKDVMAALSQGLGRKERDDFEDFYTSRRGVASWADVIEKHVELRAVTAKKPLQDEVTSLKAQVEDLKRQLRQDKGPDLAPKGGGTTDLSKARRDYAEGRMSTEEAERLGIVK